MASLTNNSPSQDSNHADDLFQSKYCFLLVNFVNCQMLNCFKFMKVCGKEHLPDVLENAKFTSMAWTHDNKGLFYNVSIF